MHVNTLVLTYFVGIYTCLIFVSCDSNIKSDLNQTTKPSTLKLDTISDPILHSNNLTDTLFLDFIYKQNKIEFEKTAKLLKNRGNIYECSITDYCFSFFLDPKKSPIKAEITPKFELDSNYLIKVILNLLPDQKVSEKYLTNKFDFDYYFSGIDVETLLNLYKNKYGNPKISNFQEQYKDFGIILREGIKNTPGEKYLKEKNEVKIIENVTKYEFSRSYLAVSVIFRRFSYENVVNPYFNKVKQITIIYESKNEIEIRNQELKLKEEANQKIIEERVIEKNKMKDKI